MFVVVNKAFEQYVTKLNQSIFCMVGIDAVYDK